MPEILSAPRSSGGTKRGGTVSSAPRSSGGSRPSGGRVLSAPRGSVSEQIARGQAGQAKQFTDAAARDTPGSPSPALTPLRIALDVASVPAYAVGQAILHPTDKRTWTASGLDIFRDEKRHVFPGQALRQRGALDAIPTKYGLRSAAAFVGDVALDPTTYLSAGGSTALKTAARGASEELVAKIARGEVVGLKDVAHASAKAATARAAVPKSVSVGLQVPFTRGKRLVLAESDALPQLIDKLATKIPERIKEAVGRVTVEPFAPAAGTDRFVHEISNGVRGAANSAKRDASRAFTKGNRAANIVIHKAGLDRYTAYHDIINAVEDPALADKINPVLKPLVEDVKAARDAITAGDVAGGITFEERTNYIAHRLLNPAEQRRFEKVYGSPAASALDNPFYVKHRVFDTVLQGEAAGFKYEVNPWRLLEARSHASIDALSKKAIDDAVAEIRGLKRPPAPVPDVAPAAAAAEAARARLGHLSSPVNAEPAAQAAAAARTAERDARARLAAAQRTGDLAGVQQARADLERIAAEGRANVQNVAAEQAAAALPEYQRLVADAQAARATLPKPSAGRYALPDVPVGVPIDPAQAAGARFLGEEAIAGMTTQRGRIINSRARRARNAQKGGPLVDLPGSTPRQRAIAKRVFNGEGHLSAEAAAVRDAATAEVEKAIRKADIAVARAEKRLKGAQGRGNAEVIGTARKQLERAQSTARQARLALERDRASYVGTPIQVAAQTKRTLKADKALVRVEREAEKVRADNATLASRPGTPISREEWKALGGEWQAFPSKYLKDVKIDPETRRGLERAYAQITPSVTTEAGLEGLHRFLRTFTSRWKALALMNPGFHIRNGLDDGVRAYWIGARSPRSYLDSFSLLTGKAKGFSLPVDGHVLDGDQMVTLAKKLGVVDSAFSSHEVAAGLAETGGSLRSATRKISAPGTGRGTQFSRKVGDLRENVMRFGTFIERIKAGDNAMEAARVTKEFHMDYGDVGRFVEQARRFWLPFVTYTSKALPLVGRQLVRKPGTLANVNKAMQALNQAGGAPDLSLLPTGQRSSFAVPLPEALRSLLGAKAGDPILYNPEKVFSFGTLNTIDPTQVQRQGLGLVSPFVKAAWEIPTGHRFYYAGPAASNVRAPWSVQQAARLPILASLLDYGTKHYRYKDQTVPGYGAVQDALLQLFPPFGASSRLTPAEGAQTVAPAVGSWLTGVRLSPYDYQRARYYSQKNKGG